MSEVDEKIEPRLLQRALHGHRIGEVAVVGDGEAAIGEFGEERLHVAQARTAGGGVARVADGAVARQPLDHRRLVKVSPIRPDMAFDVELRAVDRRRCRPLPGRDAAARAGRARRWRGVRPAENAEDAAFVVELSSSIAKGSSSSRYGYAPAPRDPPWNGRGRPIEPDCGSA